MIHDDNDLIDDPLATANVHEWMDDFWLGLELFTIYLCSTNYTHFLNSYPKHAFHTHRGLILSLGFCDCTVRHFPTLRSWYYILCPKRTHPGVSPEPSVSV